MSYYEGEFRGLVVASCAFTSAWCMCSLLTIEGMAAHCGMDWLASVVRWHLKSGGVAVAT
jgi:hypothetical protein